MDKQSQVRHCIEIRRFRKIPRDERCCLFCKNQSIAVIKVEKRTFTLSPVSVYEQYRKELYGSVDELCLNFKDLENGDKLNSFKFRWPSNCEGSC